MAEPDEFDGLAGEYVLGTLDPSERASVAARRQREPALETAISTWETRLGPLSEATPSVTPPEGLFERILARLNGAPDNAVADLTRRLRGWRVATLAASVIAASLAIFIGVREARPPLQPKNFVAVLQKDSASPAFLVSVDVDTRSLTIRPVAASQQAGKSYELWIVNDQLPAPRSLGVVRDTEFTVEPARLASYTPDLVRKSTYAVTLEPAGGSPTGLPTGPVLYSGTLVQTTP